MDFVARRGLGIWRLALRTVEGQESPSYLPDEGAKAFANGSTCPAGVQNIDSDWSWQGGDNEVLAPALAEAWLLRFCCNFPARNCMLETACRRLGRATSASFRVSSMSLTRKTGGDYLVAGGGNGDVLLFDRNKGSQEGDLLVVEPVAWRIYGGLGPSPGLNLF